MRTTRSVLLVLALAAATPAARAQSPLEVSGLAADAPLTVAAEATDSTLLVELVLGPEWHAYTRDVGRGAPVALVLDAGCDFAAAGPLRAPGDERGVLAGAARLSLPIERVGTGRALAATLHVQVCDALECLPPMSLTLSGEVAPQSVLLVVAAEDERAARISGWMRARGFEVAVATYDAVTQAACDARDVVVADSDVFREHGVGLEVVRRFPRTDSPVVAVGFLGTELVEAHEVAMTSGYI